jgi:glycosyltransferase involved in cell wall biosynthesis
MTIASTPKVSIGLAVYNGERYLQEAIDSILCQTYTDFELIISDNASTDRTTEICQEYAKRDPRVRYSRNETNIGGANNENLTFKLSRGKYFRWAAHDDVCAPNLIEKLFEVLENDPDTVLAYAWINKIDGEGKSTGFLEKEWGNESSPSARFSRLTTWDHDCETSYGMIRSDVMRKTDLQLNYTDSDRTFLCELSLHGKFTQVKEILFYKRYHPQMSTQVFQDWRQRMLWFGSSFNGKITLPHWMQFFHYLRIIGRSPISFVEKLKCYLFMPVWLIQYHRWRSMIKDVLLAAVKIVQIPFIPQKRQDADKQPTMKSQKSFDSNVQ